MDPVVHSQEGSMPKDGWALTSKESLASELFGQEMVTDLIGAASSMMELANFVTLIVK